MTIHLGELFESESGDKKIRSALLKALKENHQEGFDYLKFKKALQQLKEMGLDEETAFKSAFATASTMGLTKSKLKKSSDHYLNVLKKEQRVFAEALGNQILTKIDAKKNKTESYQKEIEVCKNKIEELKRTIDLLEQKISQVDSEVEKDRDRIEKTKEDFNRSFSEIFESIEKDVSLINQHL